VIGSQTVERTHVSGVGICGEVVEAVGEVAPGVDFVETVAEELASRELKAPMLALLEFAERLIEGEDGASCMDVLVMTGEIFEGWGLREQERELMIERFGGQSLSAAYDEFCRRHGSTPLQVCLEWWSRRGRGVVPTVPNYYVFVGNDGGALAYPDEFIGALSTENGFAALSRIDGVVVFGDEMSGIYG
jgi:hypothetical protein